MAVAIQQCKRYDKIELMYKRLELKRNSSEGTDTAASKSAASERNFDNWIKLYDLLRLLIQKRLFVTTFTLGVAVVALTVTLLIPNKYDSYASILPSGQSDKLADLKSLTGIGTSKTDENSSELFPSIIRSHLLKVSLIERPFTFEDKAKSRTLTLSEYFAENNRDNLLRKLDGIISVKSNKKTGVISVKVRTEYPALSQKILSRLLSELENFNLHKRRSRGKENATYLARQMSQKKDELRNAEERLENFRKLNRNWASSNNPDILLNLGRFEREVEVKTGTYLFLSRELEAAKFDAQKDVPIVRILDKPTFPTTKASPQRTTTVAVATVMAFLIALTIVGGTETLRRLKNGPEKTAYASYRDDLAQAFPRMNRLLTRESGREKEEVAL